MFLHHSITRGIKVCFHYKYAKCFSYEGSDQGVGVGPWASLDGLMLFGGGGGRRGDVENLGPLKDST